MHTNQTGDSPTLKHQEPMLTVSQFAKELNRHPATVRSMLKKGILRGYKIAGSKTILIPESQLKEILIPLVGDDE